ALVLPFLLAPFPAFAAAGEAAVDLTHHWIGYICLGLFIVAYALVVLEEWSGMRKSIPVLLAAVVIWVLIGCAYLPSGNHHIAADFVRHSLLEYGELLLFLLVAMTYVNTLQERNVFEALRGWLVSRGFSLR